MPRIDVTDALLDPDYLDRLVCVRGEQTVGNDGIASNAPTEIEFLGQITWKDGMSLDRVPSAERIAGAITIMTVFRLIAGVEGITADVVVFKGRRFTVAEVSDYSHFGRGFVSAKCDLLPLSGGPETDPGETPPDELS